MQSVASYQELINKELLSYLQLPEYESPKGLYEPCAYILKNGGKRVRASLVLMAAQMYSQDYHKALPVALAFETFHNFTLIHDDIMDDADIRRGQPTVHVLWNQNTAILSGDAVMILAYKFFEQAGDFVCTLLPLLNKTALQVCEGQQYDIDLEQASLSQDWVNEQMYINMIELKTSVLLAACLKAGAIVGGASEKDAERLYEIGRLLGIAFQIQDDLLDTYGNQATFGKKIGGDIAENKKTFLVLRALHLLEPADKHELLELYSSNTAIHQNKYQKVLALFNKVRIKEVTNQVIDTYFAQALTLLQELSATDDKKVKLQAFIDELRNRNY